MSTFKYAATLLFLACLSQACTVTKCVHSRGWHVEWKCDWKDDRGYSASPNGNTAAATAAIRPEAPVSISSDSLTEVPLIPEENVVAEAPPAAIPAVVKPGNVANVFQHSENTRQQISRHKKSEKRAFPRPVKTEDTTPAYSLTQKIGRMVLVLVAAALVFLICIGIIAILDFAFWISAATASFLFILAFVLVFLPTLYFSFHTFDHAVNRFGSEEARNRAYWLYALLVLLAPVGLMIVLAVRTPKKTIFEFLG